MGNNNVNGKAAKSMTEHFSLGHKAVAVAMSVVMLGFGWPAVSPANSFAENDTALTQTAASEEAADSGSASTSAEKASSAETKKAESSATSSAKSDSSAASKAAEGSDSSSSSKGSGSASSSSSAQSSEQKATQADVALDLGNAYITYNKQDISLPATKVTVPTSKDFKFTATANEGYELTAVYLAVGNGAKTEINPDDSGIFTVPSASVAAGASLKLETEQVPASSGQDNTAVSIASLDDGAQGDESSAQADSEYSVSGPTEVTMGDEFTLTFNGDASVSTWTTDSQLNMSMSDDKKTVTASFPSTWAFNGESTEIHVYCEYVDADGVWHTGTENSASITIKVNKRTFYVQDPPSYVPGTDHFWTPVLIDSATGGQIDTTAALNGGFVTFEYYRDGVKIENASQYYHSDSEFSKDGVYTVVVKAGDGWVYKNSGDITIVIPDEKGEDSAYVKYVYVGESIDLTGSGNRDHSWSNSDDTVATLDAGSGNSATVTGVKVGSTTVTHTYKSGGRTNTETYTIHVLKKPVVKELVIYGDHEVEQFKDTTLTTNVDTDVTWTSSDPSIATIDASGKVVGVKEGTVTITATTVTAEGVLLTATHEITVTASKTAATNAWVFFQNSPTANPDTNSQASWFPSGGSHSLGIKLNLEGATFSGVNSYDNVANRVVSWPDGSTGSSWELQKDHATYGQYWTAVFNAWKSTLEKEQGTTITEDDVESITLTPYKISNNSCGYHLDCKVEVKCKKAVNAIFYLQDAGSTGFAQYDAATYKLEDGKASVAAPAQTPADTKTYQGVVYKFMGWYTDQACTQSVSFPDTVTDNVNYYAKYVPMDQTIQVNYYLEGTTTSVAPSVTLTGLIKGRTITRSPIIVEGYSPVSTESKTATAGTDTEINFYYTANDVQYTVEYYWNGTDEKVADSDTGTGKVGQSVTVSPKSIEGCTAVSADGKTIGKLSPAAGENVIKFYYYKNATLTANSDNKTYNGSEQSVTGFSKNVDATFDNVTTTGGRGTNAGDYAHNFADDTINKVSTDGKYIVTKAEPGNLHISPVTDEVVIKVAGKTGGEKYNGTEQSVSGYDVDSSTLPVGISAGDVALASGMEAVATGTNADTYSMGLTAGSFALSETAAKNYTNVKFEVEDGKLTIEKRTVELTSDSDQKAYDGIALTNNNVTVGGDGFVGTDGATYNFTGSQTLVGSSPNAFSYTLKAGTNPDNYTIPKNEGTLTVKDRAKDEKYEVTVTAKSDSVTYNGVQQSVAGVTGTTYTNDKGVEFTVTGLSASVNGTDAGEYAAKVTGTAKVVDANGSDVTDQFKINKVDGKLVINKKAATITAGNATKEYDGKELTTNEFSTEGFVDGQGIESATIEGSQTVVGSSQSTVKDNSWKAESGTNLDNYTITTKPGTLTVTNRESQYSIVLEGKNETVTYNGQDRTLSGVAADKFTIDGVEFTVKNYKSDVTGKDAGTYTQVITSTNEDGSWTVVDANGNDVSAQFSVSTKAGLLTIDPKDVTVASGSGSKTYDGTPLTNNEVKVTAGGFVEGEDAGVTYECTGSQTNQGTSKNTFAVTFDGKTAKDENYNLVKVEGDLTVNASAEKVTVTITEHGGSYTYDGTQKTATGYDVLSSNKLYTTSDFSFNGNASVSGTDAGTYEMQLKPEDFTNTSTNFTNVEFVIVDGTLAIAKRNVTMTSGDGYKVYDGTPLTNNNVAVSGDGFASGEGAAYDVTGTITDSGSVKNAFSYMLNENTKADNYEITPVQGTLQIAPIASEVTVTITGNTGSTMYDGVAHSVEGFEISISGSELYNKDYVSFSGTAVAQGTDADTYNMGLAAEQFANTNKNFSNVKFVVTDGSYVIDKATVTLKSADLQKPYDGTALVNGDSALATETGWAVGEGATYSFTGSQTLVGSSANAFSYTLNSSTKASNYNISATNGTLLVTNRESKYEITVKANSGKATYDGKEHEATGVETYEFIENGQKYTVSGLSTEDPKKTDAGTYTNNITGTAVVADANGNVVTDQFSVSTQNGSLVIDKATVTLKSADLEKTYDGNALTNGTTALATETGWAEGEGATYGFTGSQTNAGSTANAFGYTLNAGVKEANYNISKSEGSLKVNPVSDKVTVTITENSASKPFNNQEQTVEGYTSASSNTLYTESCFSFVGDAGHKVAKGTAVGSYDMGLLPGDFTNTSANFTNVEFVVVDGKLTITPVDIDENSITWSTADVQHKYDGNAVAAGTATATDKFGNELHVQYSADGGKTWVDSPSQITATDYSDSKIIMLRARADYNTEGQYAENSEYLQITQRTLYFTSASASKKFDGFALTRNEQSDITIAGDGFVGNEGATFDITGSQTNVGSSPNAFTYSFNAENTKAENYWVVQETEGTLAVTDNDQAATVTVAGLNATYVYDGQAHYNAASAAAADQQGWVVEGYDPSDSDYAKYAESQGADPFTYSGKMNVSRTEVGTSYMEMKSSDFTNTATQFTGITFAVRQDGWVKITPQSIDPKDTESYKNVTVEAPEDVVYNGTEQHQKPIVKDAAGNVLVEGKDYTLTYSEDVTNAGKVTVTVTGIGNYSGEVQVSYQITPRTVNLVSESATKPYDGTALERPIVSGWEQSGNTGFVSGEVSDVKATGAVTNYDDEANHIDNNNVITYTEGAAFKASNYNISKTEGTLRITMLSAEKNITIHGEDVTHVYDGYAHAAGTATASAVDNDGNPLQAEFHIQYHIQGGPDTEWRDDPAEITWLNAYDSPVTVEIRVWARNFDGYKYGTETITITKRPVQLKTKSATKVYDGTPLTTVNDWDGYEILPMQDGGFLFDELVIGSDGYPVLGCTGSQTEVGSSENTIAYQLKEGYERNYDIAEPVLGTLTVTVQSIDPGTDPENPDPAYKGVQVSSPEDVVYDGAAHKWAPTVTDANGNPLTEGVDYEVSYSTDNFTDVTGTITVTITGKGNYTGTVERTYQITPKGYTVITDSDSRIYNGSELKAPGRIDGIVSGEDAGFAVTGSQTNAGTSTNTYEIKWNGNAKQSNYKLAEEKLGTLEVTRAAATVTAENATKVYGESDPEFKANVFGLVPGESAELITYSVARKGTDEAVGTYTGVIVPSGEEVQGNYKVSYVAANFQITKSGELTVIGQNYKMPYDGKSHGAAATPSVTEGTTVEYSIDGGDTWSATVPQVQDVADVTVKVRATNPNYEEATAEYTLKVTPKGYTVTTDTDTKVYDGAPLTATGSIVGIVEGEDAGFHITGSQTEVGESKNTYEVKWNGNAKQSNYELVGETVGTLTVTAQSIDPGTDPDRPDPAYRDVEINSPEDKTYDGEEHKWVPEVTHKDGSALVEGTDYEVVYKRGDTVTDDFINVGEITVVITGKGNYSGTVTKTYKINPVSATVTANSATKVYGDTDPSFTAEVSGLVQGESADLITYSVARKGSNEAVGTYADAIVPSGSAAQGNYVVTYVPATFTITPQSIDPGTDPENPDPSYKGVDVGLVPDVVYNGKTQEQKPTVTDKDGNPLVEGVDYEVTFSEDTVNAGTVTVTITGKGNYSGTVERTYQITPKGYSVTTEAASKVYDGAELTAPGKIEGIVEGEDAGFAVTGSQTNVGESENTYEVKWNGNAKQSNYKLESESVGTLTVTASGELAVSGTDYAGVYDGLEHGVAAVATVEEGTTVEYSTDGGDTWSEVVPTVKGVAEVAVKVRATNPNYKEATAEYTLRVTPAPLSIVTSSANQVYNGSALTSSDMAITGLVNGETLIARTTGSQTEVGSSANTYAVAGGTADLTNYEIAETLGTLTVTAAVVPVPDNAPVYPSGNNPVANNVARALADTFTAVTGEEATAAPEEQIYDEENPLGTEVHSCWVHFYMIICMVLTALYGLFVAFRRGNHTHQLKKDMNDVMGDGGDDGKDPVATTKPAGTEA